MLIELDLHLDNHCFLFHRVENPFHSWLNGVKAVGMRCTPIFFGLTNNLSPLSLKCN